MYRMKQFAAMTGMTQSKIRFYEKHGLVLSDRMENGYRVFTPEDAFRSNAFRVLLQYGFSISEAIEMLDAKQDTAEFRESLQEQRQKLERERILLDYRQRRIESVLDVLETDGKVDFKLVHIPDQLYVNASHGRDFTVSMENEKVLAECYDLLSITSCARIITRENLLDDSPAVDPDYINTVSVGEEHFLSPYAREHVKRLRLGRCLRFRRMVTREESIQKETFDGLFEHLDAHGLTICGDILIMPTFLNLDGEGSDIEVLYVPMIVDRPHGSSFPSGHATAAFAAFGALLFSKGPKTLVIVVGIGALLMALTRLYCYVHYPTDVLAGTVVGLLAGFAAAKIVEAASRKLQERRSQSHT